MSPSFRNARAAVLATAALGASLLLACGEPAPAGPRDFPGDPDGKVDVFGRSLIGLASPYRPDPSLADPAADERLRADMGYRRQIAWQTVYKVLEAVPLYGLAEVAEENPEIELPDGEVPLIPRFQTWYGVEEIKRMFQYLYQQQGPAGRAVRAPFDAQAIEDAFAWNASAVERSSRWPLDRYLRYVERLGACDGDVDAEACAQMIQGNFAGAAGGIARIGYSPGTVRGILGSYGRIYECLDELGALPLAATPESDDNFTACMNQELAPDAVLIKAQWLRADIDSALPTFDTDADAMGRLLAENASANWGTDGDRKTDPGAEEIYTIRLRDGSVYRLAGLHVMTKEVRHWQWVSLWWSDRPDEDFGADRPAAIATLEPIWQRYKMCAVSWYDEQDPQPGAHFGDAPSLAAALAVTAERVGAASWCSNPYIEHGRNNARTNCIGCHQHGGSQVGPDADGDGDLDPFDLEAVIADERLFPRAGTAQLRTLFPADYLWSFNRVDDFAGMMAREIDYFDSVDENAIADRIAAVLSLDGDAAAGAEVFAERCAPCHGPDGKGTGWAPSLYQRVPMRSDEDLVQTLIQGRGGMPAWGEILDNPALADVLAHLRATF